MADAETRYATELVARIIRDNPDADPDVVAVDIVALLRARSWRHVPSLSTVPDDLHHQPRPPSDDYRQARAHLSRKETTP